MSPSARRRLFPPLALVLLALAFAAPPASADPGDPIDPAVRAQWYSWATNRTERRAFTWKRTREELDRYSRHCEWTAPRYSRVVESHRTLDRVIVWDARHGYWTGLGDAMLRHMGLLRVGRATDRATFIWLDACADRDGPARVSTTDRSNGTECSFDTGAYWRGYGRVDWQWSEANRKRAEKRHGASGETLILHDCGRAAGMDGVPCRFKKPDGTLLFEIGGEPKQRWPKILAFLQSIPEPWIRVELIAPEDMFNIAEDHAACHAAGISYRSWHPDNIGCGNKECEFHSNLRPKSLLWTGLRPHLDRVEQWDGFVGVTMRTGFADHADNFPELSVVSADLYGRLSAAELGKTIEGIMRQCPADHKKAWRELPHGKQPCVSWSPGVNDPTYEISLPEAERKCMPERAAWQFGPGTGLGGSYGAFLDCAGMQAMGLAGGSDRWGVYVVSDAPGLKCVAEGSPMGKAGHVLATPTAWGHVQYVKSDRAGAALAHLHRVSLLAAVDFHMLSFVDSYMKMFPSAFPDSATYRSFSHRGPHGHGGFRHGFEQWFWGGRERAAGRKAANITVLALLAATNDECPIQMNQPVLQALIGGEGRGAAAAAEDDGADAMDDVMDLGEPAGGRRHRAHRRREQRRSLLVGGQQQAEGVGGAGDRGVAAEVTAQQHEAPQQSMAGAS